MAIALEPSQTSSLGVEWEIHPGASARAARHGSDARLGGENGAVRPIRALRARHMTGRPVW